MSRVRHEQQRSRGICRLLHVKNCYRKQREAKGEPSMAHPARPLRVGHDRPFGQRYPPRPWLRPPIVVLRFRASTGRRGSSCFLVYLYKRGTFYPFAPLDGERRDNELELRLRGVLAADLPTGEDTLS